jgi:hypothetical protein
MGISLDYLLKIRTSKQSIGEISGYEIIPSHPLKYPRSKQGLSDIFPLFTRTQYEILDFVDHSALNMKLLVVFSINFGTRIY